ncbi:MAG: 50S ribosomal protein L22 [Gemmatimonadaceae bacterium]
MAEKKGGKPAARKKAAARPAAKKAPAKKATAAKAEVVRPEPTRIKYEPREARALQRMARQSPYKMRLVIDQIRGKTVNEAIALLTFSKKHAAKQIEKVLKSAVANAENRARPENATLDVDELFVKYAVVNEGQKMKRWTPAAMGRATPMIKRTSHIEIVVAERPGVN